MSSSYSYKSFRDKDTYVSWNVWEYCMDAYSFLSELEDEQKIISQLLLSTNPESKSINLEKINEKIKANSDKLSTTEIVKVEWTEQLTEQLTTLNDKIKCFKEDFAKILSEGDRVNLYSSIEEIGIILEKVSKKNIGNFSIHFKNSEDFKTKVLDRLKDLKPIIESWWTFDSNLLEKYDSLRTEAVKVYSMKFDMENLGKKADAAWVDLNDIARQMFWWNNW